MTRDIFNPPFGTLDLIVYIVLQRLGILGTEPLHCADSEMDGVAHRNAVRLYEHFTVNDRPIQAIKTIREVTNIGLKQSKMAWDQIIETYIGQEEHYARQASAAMARNDYDTASYYLNRARFLRDGGTY